MGSHINASSLMISPSFFLLLSNLFALLWKWTPRGCAAYLPGRNGLSSIKLMEARWRAGHRGEELGQPPRRRQRVEEKREGGKRVERVREGSTGSISASHWRVRLRYPPPLQWHTLACSWPGGHMLATSYSMCTDHYCGHSTDGERKAHSDGRPERE